MQNTSLGTIRPNYEMRQLRLYIATALVYLSIARLNPELAGAVLPLAIGSLLLGCIKLPACLERKQDENRFAGKYRRPCHLSTLIKLSRTFASINAVWLGNGFDWEPRHRQKVQEMQRCNWNAFYQKINRRKIRNELLFHHPLRALLHPTQTFFQLRNLPYFVTTAQGFYWIHALNRKSKRILLPRTDMLTHTLVIGSSGAGKTSLLKLLMNQAIINGDVTILIDPKGDKAFFDSARTICQLCGREFHYFHPAHPQDSTPINVLGNFQRPADIASRIAEVIPGTSGDAANFKAMGRSAVECILVGMELMNESPTFIKIWHYFVHRTEFAVATLRAWLIAQGTAEKELPCGKSPDILLENLIALCRSHQNTSPDIDSVIAFATKSDEILDKTTSTMKDILMQCSRGDIGRLLSPSDDSDTTFFDARKILQRKCVFYLGTDSLTNAAFARVLGALFLSDLANAAGDIYNFGTAKSTRVTLIVDEASEVVCEPFISMLSKARGANFSIIAATQTINDFTARLDKEAGTKRILGNILNLIVMRCSDTDTQKLVAEGIPKTSIFLKTQTQSESRAGADLLADSASLSERLTEQTGEYLIPPELFGALPAGEAFAIVSGKFVSKLYAPLLIDDLSVQENRHA